MTIGIYCIENIQTEQKYIGKSVNIETRLKRHRYQLIIGKHHNQYLQRVVDKHGLDSLKMYVLEAFDAVNAKLLKDREGYFMEVFDTFNTDKGYNLSKDTDQAILVSDVTRAKMVEACSGKKNHNYGKPRSEETRKKIAKANSGANNYNFGKKGSDHHCFGKVISEEHKQLLSRLNSGENSPLYGKKGKDHPSFGKRLTAEEKILLSLTKVKYSYAQYALDGTLIKIWDSIIDIKKVTNFDSSCIAKVCNGILKKHGGYIWKKLPKGT